MGDIVILVFHRFRHNTTIMFVAPYDEINGVVKHTLWDPLVCSMFYSFKNKTGCLKRIKISPILMHK